MEKSEAVSTSLLCKSFELRRDCPALGAAPIFSKPRQRAVEEASPHTSCYRSPTAHGVWESAALSASKIGIPSSGVSAVSPFRIATVSSVSVGR